MFRQKHRLRGVTSIVDVYNRSFSNETQEMEMRSAECGVRNAECGVLRQKWKMSIVESAEYD